MSFEQDIDCDEDNLATESNIEMSDVNELESTGANQFPFNNFQSDFISTKQLEKMAEPFQHLFGESFSSKAEINPSILKPRSPWEDESFENFIPFLTQPKKPKLSDISDQTYSTDYNTMDGQPCSSTGVEKQKLSSQEWSKPDYGDDDVLSHHLTCNTSEQTQGDEIKEETIPQKPQLFPGYKPGACVYGGIRDKEGELDKLPTEDLTSLHSYNFEHTKLLVEQFVDLIKEEKENNNRVKEIQTVCKDGYSKSHPFHKDLTTALDHSTSTLNNCAKACGMLCEIEIHGVRLFKLLSDKGYGKNT